jgi:uncharacterized membrane protein
VWTWLRRSFVTGLIVTVPLVVTVVALVWVVRLADYLTQGLDQQVFGYRVPGLGIAVTLVAVLSVGALASNVLGKRILQRGEGLLLHVPLFRTIYAPVKQLISAFSPENAAGFKKMVLVELEGRGFVMGFLTKEFRVDRGSGLEPMIAVYVPTNHLYLGDVIVCPAAQATYPDLSVEEGIRVFLTGGMAIPGTIAALRADIGKRGRAG